MNTKKRDHRDEIAFSVERDTAECEVSEAALEQPFALGVLLRDEAKVELDRREGEWSAFSSAVLRRINQLEVAEERKSVEDRAISLFKEQVHAELGELAPRFERDFKDGIEQRIWRAARERPTFRERFAEWMASWRSALVPRMVGVAAVAAAVMLTINVWPPPVQSLVAVGDGQVSVDRVSFQGSVTVMNEGGITVVWLADDATS